MNKTYLKNEESSSRTMYVEDVVQKFCRDELVSSGFYTIFW